MADDATDLDKLTLGQSERAFRFVRSSLFIIHPFFSQEYSISPTLPPTLRDLCNRPLCGHSTNSGFAVFRTRCRRLEIANCDWTRSCAGSMASNFRIGRSICLITEAQRGYIAILSFALMK